MKRNLIILFVFLTVFSLSACNKEPVIGYEPEMPQEWIDSLEREKKNPYTEVVRTSDFEGIWQLESTGQLYRYFENKIFKIDSVDTPETDYELIGGATVAQMMLKEEAANLNASGGNAIKEGEKFDIHHYLTGVESVLSEMVALKDDRTKTITEDGRELIFKRVVVDDAE